MIREIKISAALNGYTAKVGCQTLVFNSRPEMLKELDRYLEKPDEVEKEYREKALNRSLLNEPAVACEDAPRAVEAQERQARATAAVGAAYPGGNLGVLR